MAPPVVRVHLHIRKEDLAVMFTVSRRCIHGVKSVLCSTCFEDDREKPMTESVQGLFTAVPHSFHDGAMISPTS